MSLNLDAQQNGKGKKKMRSSDEDSKTAAR